MKSIRAAVVGAIAGDQPPIMTVGQRGGMIGAPQDMSPTRPLAAPISAVMLP